MATNIGPETRAKIESHWPEILIELAAGAFIVPMLARLGLRQEWIRAYIASAPALRQEWELAREQSGDAYAERALEMALNPCQVIPQGEGKEPLIVPLEPAHARNAIDTLKWAARIRNPRAYSDKAQLDINVKTVDLTRIISEANARLAAGRQGRVLEHDAPSPDAHIVAQGAKLLELL